MNDDGRPRETGANPSQLRAKIDSGQTGDKVPFPDPAAAPLGTDDEAAGATPSPAAIQADIVRETSRSAPNQAPDASGPWVWALVVAALLVIAAATAVLFWPAA